MKVRQKFKKNQKNGSNKNKDILDKRVFFTALDSVLVQRVDHSATSGERKRAEHDITTQTWILKKVTGTNYIMPSLFKVSQHDFLKVHSKCYGPEIKFLKKNKFVDWKAWKR